MSGALTTLLGAVGTVAAVLAVLLPVILAQGKSLRRELDHLRGDVASLDARVTADVAEVRRDLHALSDRVARIEGALSGPWRPPANGTPAPASPAAEAST